MLAQFAQEAEALEIEQRERRNGVHKGLQMSAALLEQNLGKQVDAALEKVLVNQRRLENECVGMGKCASQLHQKTVRWKAEHKRFKYQLAELESFEQWALETEACMHEISGKLEYVCHEVNRLATEKELPRN